VTKDGQEERPLAASFAEALQSAVGTAARDAQRRAQAESALAEDPDDDTAAGVSERSRYVEHHTHVLYRSIAYLGLREAPCHVILRLMKACGSALAPCRDAGASVATAGQLVTRDSSVSDPFWGRSC
jgi:hypothetical protein